MSNAADYNSRCGKSRLQASEHVKSLESQRQGTGARFVDHQMMDPGPTITTALYGGCLASQDYARVR